jgi:hypothetical protein
VRPALPSPRPATTAPATRRFAGRAATKSSRGAEPYRPTDADLAAARKKLASDRNPGSSPPARRSGSDYRDTLDFKIMDAVFRKLPEQISDWATPLVQRQYDALVKDLQSVGNKISIDGVLGKKKTIDVGPPSSAGDTSGSSGKLIFDDNVTGKDSAATVAERRSNLANKIAELGDFWDQRIREARQRRDEMVKESYKSPGAATAEMNKNIAAYEKQRAETLSGLRNKLADLGGSVTTANADIRRAAIARAAQELGDKVKGLGETAANLQKSLGWSKQKTERWLNNRVTEARGLVSSKWKPILEQTLAP